MLLAVFAWWLCGFSMWLWNRRFHMRLGHHLLCAITAIVTCSACFVFQCLGQVESHALEDLHHWRESYLSDGQFGWNTFLLAHDKLRELYRENGWAWDSRKYPEPPRTPPEDSGKYILPGDRQEGNAACLKIYCDRCITNLTASQPILSRILWQGEQIDINPLRNDLADFQQNNPGGIYDFTAGSLKIAGNLCLAQLDQEVPRLVWHFRLALIALFLLTQIFAFGLAGYSAYSDLKIDH